MFVCVCVLKKKGGFWAAKGNLGPNCSVLRLYGYHRLTLCPAVATEKELKRDDQLAADSVVLVTTSTDTDNTYPYIVDTDTDTAHSMHTHPFLFFVCVKNTPLSLSLTHSLSLSLRCYCYYVLQRAPSVV